MKKIRLKFVYLLPPLIQGRLGGVEYMLYYNYNRLPSVFALTTTTPNPSYTRRGIKNQIREFSIPHLLSLFLIFLLFIPTVISAQAPNPAPVNTVLTNFLALLTIVMKILFSLAFVIFGWGMVTFIFTANDPKKVEQAKYIMLYGIIGIFVLVSMGGIIIFLKTYFGIPDNPPIKPPTFTTFLIQEAYML